MRFFIALGAIALLSQPALAKSELDDPKIARCVIDQAGKLTERGPEDAVKIAITSCTKHAYTYIAPSILKRFTDEVAQDAEAESDRVYHQNKKLLGLLADGTDPDQVPVININLLCASTIGRNSDQLNAECVDNNQFYYNLLKNDWLSYTTASRVKGVAFLREVALGSNYMAYQVLAARMRDLDQIDVQSGAKKIAIPSFQP